MEGVKERVVAHYDSAEKRLGFQGCSPLRLPADWASETGQPPDGGSQESTC